MGHVRTSAIFYRRGVPNNNPTFGVDVYGNYPIVQPQSIFINSINNGPKFSLSSFINTYQR